MFTALKLGGVGASIVLLSSQNTALADSVQFDHHVDVWEMLDNIWVICAACLMLLMQVGFLLIEAGSVRSKNSVNVAIKNILDFCASTLSFALIGFTLAFGTSLASIPLGFDLHFLGLSDLTPKQSLFFTIQLMFCGAAATIVSGAVAGRMRLPAYVLGSAIIGGLIYPVFAHWAWGDALLGANDGAFLANLGFVDFAGSTVVHATGAWMALAACILLGPRAGRFKADGKAVRIAGHSPVLGACGALLLLLGWIGLNGGSTMRASFQIFDIIRNTLLAASAAGVCGFAISHGLHKKVLPEHVFSGMIGGLVAVTAGCHLYSPSFSLLVGALGSAAAISANEMILHRLKIDDAVGAIGVHGAAGVTGTLCVAFFAPLDVLPADTRLEQLRIQFIGVGFNFVWTFIAGLIFFYLVRSFMGIRVSNQAEAKGLNQAEHLTPVGFGVVEDQLLSLVHDGDLKKRLKVDLGSDSERLASLFNTFLDNLQDRKKAHSKKRNAQRKHEQAQQMSTLADATFEALCICEDDLIKDGNHALAMLLEAELDDIRSTRLHRYFSAHDLEKLSGLNQRPDNHSEEFTLKTVKGDTIPVEVRSRDVHFGGSMTRVLAIIDLRERKAAEDRIRFLAQHDPMTNLANRVLFNGVLAKLVANADNEPGCVILIDLDRFKDVNDIYGHAVGDFVIRFVAKRLQELVGEDDKVARLGGDEFAIIQPKVTCAADAVSLAEEIIGALSTPIPLDNGHSAHIGASAGIALYPLHARDHVKLMACADIALFQAKNAGRNRAMQFDPGMEETALKRQTLEKDLSLAIENGQLEVHYQPRMNAFNATIDSYEALLRWRHPERGFISPVEFIPVAEASGQILEIGEWVLREACRTAARQMKGESVSVSVNASPLQLRHPKFADMVMRTLEEVGLSPERLEIEVTESMMVDDDERALEVFEKLKAVGVRLALDDFGTGYSSLSYLSRFPFDSLKIDQSFVKNLKQDASCQSIIKSIIEMARALNLRIVAEGVETLEELAILLQFNCDEIQGFLIGRPNPITRLQTEAPSSVHQILTSPYGKKFLHELKYEFDQKVA